MNLSIKGYSTALFATWYFVEELGLLFDGGDGLMAGLLQKSRKINHAFISHADRDHLGGLLQFNQLNARDGAPFIYYPKDCGSFPNLERFFEKFDPHMAGTVWQSIVSGEEIEIKDNIVVKAFRNEHVPCASGMNKSLSFKVYEKKRKLKQEFLSMPKNELKDIIVNKGREFVTEEIATNILSYSGDTPVDDLSKWEGTKLLIHEATFLEKLEKHPERANRHSVIDEVFEMLSHSKVEKVILGHFSSRYSSSEIDKKVRELSEKYALDIPIYCVYPGEIFQQKITV
ncbi:MAG: RNAse Z [Cytophagales bacterium]|nr:RNAse Z [Cytophagales bacterium]